MNNYRAILKRVGIVLIIVGILDIVYFFQVIPPESRSYSSSFFYLIAIGVLFLCGNLRAVPLVTWGSALLLSYFVTSLLILLPLRPAELWATEFRLDSVSFSLSLLYKIAEIVLLFWVYTQLRTTAVVRATVKSGYSASTPKLAFILGVVFVAVITGMMHFIRVGETGVKAVEIAQAQYGEVYKYHITGISWENGQVRASLIAYNKQEIKPVKVEWNSQ
ncbi:hypothetical protein [Lyngbya sp. PCC 8106]|uniref:hypothetical protein n=1 Tax=Lyngbya sp. (strain PCC 8106) TaxID=313612 RepID=UPI0000EAC7B2|nr:hypothetical protein [Lyngbya sp. PCC 8106]EAW38609.1 hypothetical protein L8106_14380 [Lyngbya sp. PCC 8106]